MAESSTSGLTRILGKTLGGQSGISETYQYSQEWDMDDRKRLDAIRLNISKVSSQEWINNEDGKEDHAVEEDWLNRRETIENLQVKKEDLANTKRQIEFSGIKEDSKLQDLNIHEATLSQSTNVTASEEGRNSFALSDVVNRGKGTKARKDYTTADIIYKIQALEFVDLREQLYRKFDPFFKYSKGRTCL